MTVVPRLVAWEVTRKCNLHCRHCRAAAEPGPYAGELNFGEAKALVDDLASFCKPILILTGGEPLLCEWLFDIVAYARERGLSPVIGTNATLIDGTMAERIAAAGVKRLSVSLDFPTAEAHDAFRGETGAFAAALRGIAALRRAGVEVQVNTTVTKLNRHLLPALHELAVKADVQAFHPFLLVPTGRGADLAGVELSAEDYEETLQWVWTTQQTSPLEFKPTDAPQYQRIVRQHCVAGTGCHSKGCLAGTGFCFVSHVGDVQPCGYFDLKLGNVRQTPLSRIWAESPVLEDLRHPERLKGKCGACEYKTVCGGCRARALAKTGDYLAEEPYCTHQPRKSLESRLLDRVQSDFPVSERPYAILAKEFGCDESQVYDSLCELRRKGLVRRIGAFFDARKLGFVSTLVAMAVEEPWLDEVAEKVGTVPNVTHDYSRHPMGTVPMRTYNLWVTVIAKTRAEIERIVGQFASLPHVLSVLELPAVKTYKLCVDFSSSLRGSVPGNVRGPVPENEGENARVLKEGLRDCVQKYQGDILDLGLEPFANDDVERLRSLMANGVVRRFGAVVNHLNLGYRANALVAWQVAEDCLDAAGMVLANSSAVSHCYARTTVSDWPYNLYAMVHARSRPELTERISELVALVEHETGRKTSLVALETVREYKKASMRYF